MNFLGGGDDGKNIKAVLKNLNRTSNVKNGYLAQPYVALYTYVTGKCKINKKQQIITFERQKPDITVHFRYFLLFLQMVMTVDYFLDLF